MNRTQSTEAQSGEDNEMSEPRASLKGASPSDLVQTPCCRKHFSNQHVQSKEEKLRLGVIWHADSAFMSGEHNEGEHGMQPALVLI